MECFASCPSGLEQMLKRELEDLGFRNLRPLIGRVAFEAEPHELARMCAYARVASRIHMVLARVDASSDAAFYKDVYNFAWEEHIDPNQSFVIFAHGTNDAFQNSHYVALRTKDALVDKMFEKSGVRPQTNFEHPDLVFSVHVNGEGASISLDCTGSALFMRAEAASPIDLRADFAAATLMQAHFSADRALVLLSSHAQTLLTEAAGIAEGSQAQANVEQMPLFKWKQLDVSAAKRSLAYYKRKKSEGAHELIAYVLIRRGFEQQNLNHALRRFGLSSTQVHYVTDMNALVDMLNADEHEPLVIQDSTWIFQDQISEEASSLATLAHVSNYECALLAQSSILQPLFDEGALEVQPLRQAKKNFDLVHVAAGHAQDLPEIELAGKRVKVMIAGTDQFAKRLAKNYKARSAWAAEEYISAYRVYDADLPDYNLAIDVIDDIRGIRHLAISEYAAPAHVDAGIARARLMDAAHIASKILGAKERNIHLKVRTRAKGGSQYADAGRSREIDPKRNVRVEEGGLVFDLNFDARLDYGLFLDHRPIREQIREDMKQAAEPKRFLNLFCYTGSATVYAADGGARECTSVDMSKPSLEWAKRNFQHNGFKVADNFFIQQDVLTYVREAREKHYSFDLIFCDVPTFSNSKKMGRRTWDVQADHASLIIDMSRLLTQTGHAYFSCNLKNFKLDAYRLARAGVGAKDITAETIPQDFERTPDVHHCFKIWRMSKEEEAAYLATHEDTRPDRPAQTHKRTQFSGEKNHSRKNWSRSKRQSRS